MPISLDVNGPSSLVRRRVRIPKLALPVGKEQRDAARVVAKRAKCRSDTGAKSLIARAGVRTFRS